jgi:hypothetical protein
MKWAQMKSSWSFGLLAFFMLGLTILNHLE